MATSVENDVVRRGNVTIDYRDKSLVVDLGAVTVTTLLAFEPPRDYPSANTAPVHRTLGKTAELLRAILIDRLRTLKDERAQHTSSKYNYGTGLQITLVFPFGVPEGAMEAVCDTLMEYDLAIVY